MVVIPAKPIVKGQVEAEVLFSRCPISFIGGVDPKTGIIRDPLNDCQGKSMADKIYIFPFGKGSSGAGLVLLELARVGKAPTAMINLRTDSVVLTGPLICREFYQKLIAVVNVDEAGMAQLATAKRVRIDTEGTSVTIFE
jgi:predicted aconitase with swiveling domain